MKRTRLTQVGALFDLDGVIIDSEGTYSQFWEEMERIYPTGIENYAMAIKGTTLPEILKHYGSEDVRRDIERRLMAFQGEMKYKIYDGAENFLVRLREAGVPVALVTSSDHRKMEALFQQLPQLQKYFDVVIDGSMVKRSKPAPDPYLQGAEAIEVVPEKCVVFEDSLQGLQSGINAGCKVIGLATTYGRDRIESMADMVVDSLSDSYESFYCLTGVKL